MGFAVTVLLDARKPEFDRKLGEFSERASASDVALVYYAGHGIEIDGMNYLIPVDAVLETDKKAPFETVSLDSVMKAVEGAQKLKIVILDACRNNPFIAEMRTIGSKRAIHRGLGELPKDDLTKDDNSIVAFSAAPGAQAEDGDGENSPYTTAFLKRVDENVEIGMLFRKIRDDVRRSTGAGQTPYLSANLTGEEIFLSDKKAETKDTVEGDKPGPSADDAGAAAAWEFVKDTNSEAVLKTYIDRYGANPTYSRLARQKLASLTSQKQVLPSDSAVEPAVNVAENLKLAAQIELTRLGCYSGPADGLWGKGSEFALRKFMATSKSIVSSLEISAQLLDFLKNAKAPGCSNPCRQDEASVDGQCRKTQCAAGQIRNGQGICTAKVARPKKLALPAKAVPKADGCVMLDGTKYCP